MDERLKELERRLASTRRQGWALFTVVLMAVSAVACTLAFWPDAAAAQPDALGKRKATPTATGMQELFNLSVRRNKLQLDLQVVEKLMEKAEQKQFAGFERVATPTGTDYWESISDNVVYAKATAEIQADELLLYHAPGIYRVKDSKPKLTTKGECWYFRPDRKIAAGQAFTIELIHDAPEELANVKQGFAPHTDRARDPARAYKTKVHLSR
jgi:hypothetical protein